MKKQHKSEFLKMRTEIMECRKELEIKKNPFRNEKLKWKDTVWKNTQLMNKRKRR